MDITNSPFLSATEGITQTSAQHLSNLAALKVTEIKSVLDGVDFITTGVKLGGEDNLITTKVGVDQKYLNQIEDNLNLIGQFNSFIAWVMEAIKSKQELLHKINKIDDFSFIKIFPEYAELLDDNTKFPEAYSFEDALNELSIKDRARYYSLEARAAAIGKYIHKGGAFDSAYKRMLEVIKHPSDVKIDTLGNSVYAITYNNTSISLEDCSKIMNKLQSLHRETEREFNQMKYELNEKVSKKSAEIAIEKRSCVDRKTSNLQKLRLLMSEYIRTKSESIGKLKIIIPNNLKETYEYLNSLK